MADNESIGTRSFGTGDHTPPPEAPSAVQHSTPRSQLTTNSLAELPRTRIADADPDWQVPNLPAAIGRFKVLDLLGHGGFGFVYRAYDPDLNRQVALKVPRADAVSEQFLEEARAAAQLKHPNIVTIYDVGRCDEGRFFIAMEFVDGPNLSTWVCRDPRSPKEVAAVVARVAEAVHFAHKSGFVHRDLKPGNILIDCDGSPKVADFGLALHESQQHLRQGEVAGTPAFMAPEQITGTTQQIDGRTDIWALGVILYRLLSGRQPFDVARGDLHEQILRLDPKPLRQIDDSIPLELEDLCRDCLQKRPADRPATARDVSRRLEEFCRLSAAGAQESSGSDVPGTMPSRAAVVFGLLAVVLLAVFAFSQWDAGALVGAPSPRDEPARPSMPQSPPVAVREVSSVAERFLATDTSTGSGLADPSWEWLRGPFQPLFWRVQDDQDSYATDDERRRLSVRSSGTSLFAVGKLYGNSCSLRTQVSIDGGEGRVGVFWGAREPINGGIECQFVRVGRISVDSPLEVQYGTIGFAPDSKFLGQPVREVVWNGVVLGKPTASTVTIQIELTDAILTEVRVNDAVVLSQDQLNHASKPQPAIAGHSTGLYAEKCLTLFHSFQLKE